MLRRFKLFGTAGIVAITSLTMMKVTSCGKRKKDEPSSETTNGGNVNVKVTGTSSTVLSSLMAEGCDCSTPGTSMGGPVCGSNPHGK